MPVLKVEYPEAPGGHAIPRPPQLNVPKPPNTFDRRPTTKNAVINDSIIFSFMKPTAARTLPIVLNPAGTEIKRTKSLILMYLSQLI